MRTLKDYFKTRNLTHKNYSYFKENKMHYLTPEELQKLPSKPIQYKKHKKVDVSIKIERPDIDKSLVKEIRGHFKGSESSYNEDETTIVYRTHPKSGYKIFSELGCKNRELLNLHELGKGFTYFNVASVELSPSGEYFLLIIDFIGSRLYHLFINFTNDQE